MRVELRDGQWAELRERITHGQVKAVLRAYRADDLEFMATVTRTFVRDWHITDPDGNPIPLDAPDAIDRMPEDVAQALYSEVIPLWRAKDVSDAANLAPTPPSSDA